MNNKEYYIFKNDEQFGPYSYEQLKELNLTSNSLIWHEGLQDWTLVVKVDELSALVKKMPPPIENISNYNSKVIFDDKKGNNKLVKIFKNSLFLSILFLIVLGSLFFLFSKKNITDEVHNNSNTNVEYNKENRSSSFTNSENLDSPTNNYKSSYQEAPKKLTPEELREKLIKEESEAPKEHIKFKIKNVSENKIQTRNPTMFRRSKWRKEGYILELDIKNIATLATFKDLVFKINYISNTGAVIDSFNFTVYDYFAADEYKVITQKIDSIDGAVDLKIELISAIPVL